jgi:hypothetical protein
MQVIQTVQDFVDASAFEQNALAIVYPLVNAQSDRGGLDLRSNAIRVQVHSIEDVAEEARNALIHELRPLLFGAAWKILDLLVEYGLNQTTPQAHWTIQAKQAQASSAVVTPLSNDPDVWSRVAALYANTVEARHCLIHRRFVFSATGDMTQLVDRQGVPMPDVTAEEQNAFCRIAQRASIILQLGRFTPRDRLDIVASLDKMAAHHGLGVLGGGASARLPELAQVNAQQSTAGWTVDIATALDKAEEIFPGRAYFDIEVSFPGTGLPPLVGRLEDAPRESAVLIDPASPPAWIDL